MKFVFCTFSDGRLEAIGEYDGDPASAEDIPQVAQGKRGYDYHGGKKIECATVGGVKYMLATMDESGEKTLHEKMPPAPRIGDETSDKNALKHHDNLVSMQKFKKWLEQRRKGNA